MYVEPQIEPQMPFQEENRQTETLEAKLKGQNFIDDLNRVKFSNRRLFADTYMHIRVSRPFNYQDVLQ